MAESKQPALTLTVANKEELYRAYMPWLRGGGIFVPTPHTVSLGTEVLVLLTVLDQGERFAFKGEVAWITPVGAGHKRRAGVGVQFPEGEDSPRLKLETFLGGALGANRPTETM